MAGAGGSVSTETTLISQDDSGAAGTVAIDSKKPSQVDATGTKVVSGGFASVFGFRSFTVRAYAAAGFGPGAAFNYAVFQGSSSSSNTLTFESNQDVTSSQGSSSLASIHSNGSISLGGNVRIQGDVNAGGSVTLSANATAGSQHQYQPQMSMPQWNLPTPPATTSFTTVKSLPSGSTISGNYLVSTSNVTIAGNTTVNGSIMVTNGYSITLSGNATVNGSIYVTGGGGITVSGNDAVNGNLVVEQGNGSSSSNITLEGNDTVTGYVIDQGGAVSISGNGNISTGSTSTGVTIGDFAYNGLGGTGITLSGNETLTGIAYAPMGLVSLQGNNTVTGAVVGNTVQLAGNTSVTYDTSVVDSTPFQSIALTQ